MAFQAPVVDELAIRVVVDSRYERFLPRTSHPHVQIEHIGRIPGRADMTFAAEWGLSLHLASVKDGAKTQYLLDFGYTPEIINRNFDLLGIDPTRINGLILSHGHRDHFGGLDGFVQ
jgi:7,8-dihydropterin-6-yl-methyl-4-(beta-D-ribofuranosyl)aminobenzene 5'-phosphate synthase